MGDMDLWNIIEMILATAENRPLPAGAAIL